MFRSPHRLKFVTKAAWLYVLSQMLGPQAWAQEDWQTRCDLSTEGYSECVNAYREGLAAVRTVSSQSPWGLWGYLDKQGRMAIVPTYEQAENFSQGLAAAKHQGKWGYIDPQGQWVIPPRFDSASAFNAQGHAFVERGQQHLMIDRTGREIKAVPWFNDYHAPGTWAETAVIDVQPGMALWNLPTGTPVVLPQDVVQVGAPSDGLIPAGLLSGRFGVSWGFLSPDMSWAVPPQLLAAAEMPLHHGAVFAVRRAEQWHFVNAQGKALQPVHYQAVQLLRPGLWQVRTHQDDVVLLDAHLQPLTSGYVEITDAKAGLVWVRKQDRPAGAGEDDPLRHRLVQVYDAAGRALLGEGAVQKLARYEAQSYDRGLGEHAWALARLSPDGEGESEAILTVDGRILSNPEWQSIRELPAGKAPLIVEDREGLHGLVGPDGQWLSPQRYASIKGFKNGMTWAKLPPQDDGSAHYVVLDEAGQAYPVPPQVVMRCGEMAQGMLICPESLEEDRPPYHLWDIRKGQRASQASHDEIAVSEGGALLARQGDLWGVIDFNGRWTYGPSRLSSYDIKLLDAQVASVQLEPMRSARGERESRYQLINIHTGQELSGPLREPAVLEAPGLYRTLGAQGELKLVDAQGRAKFTSAQPLRELRTSYPWAVALLAELKGLLDGNGDWRLPPVYAELEEPAGAAGWLKARLITGEEQIIDQQGKVIFAGQGGYAAPVTGGKLIAVSDATSTALLNADGQEVARLKGVMALRPINGDVRGDDFALFEEDDRFGFIDAQGKKVVPPVFDQLRGLRNGRALAMQVSRYARRWGYVDHQARFVIAGQYERASDFSDERALVSRKDQMQFIDTQGQVTASFSQRCGQFVVHDAQGKQSWPLQSLNCGGKVSKKGPR